MSKRSQERDLVTPWHTVRRDPTGGWLVFIREGVGGLDSRMKVEERGESELSFCLFVSDRKGVYPFMKH